MGNFFKIPKPLLSLQCIEPLWTYLFVMTADFRKVCNPLKLKYRIDVIHEWSVNQMKLFSITISACSNQNKWKKKIRHKLTCYHDMIETWTTGAIWVISRTTDCTKWCKVFNLIIIDSLTNMLLDLMMVTWWWWWWINVVRLTNWVLIINILLSLLLWMIFLRICIWTLRMKLNGIIIIFGFVWYCFDMLRLMMFILL